MPKFTTVLSSTGQVTIPARRRRTLGWEPGLVLQIQWSCNEPRLMLVPIHQTRRPTAVPAAGALREVYPPSTDYVRAIRDEAERC